MIIEGKNPVKEAIKAKTKINKIYIQQNLHDTKDIAQAAKNNGAKVIFAEKNVLDKLSPSGRHQGLLAVADEFAYSTLEEIIALAQQKSGNAIILVLDGIEDPHNLGSIIRVAECAGVTGIIIPKHRSVSVNDTAVKTSAGASAYVKVAMVTNLNDAIRVLKDNFFNVVCTDADGENIYQSHLVGDLALVIGSEGYGVKQLTKKLCDFSVAIPQYGQINSLNASVACGIAVFESLRQRNSK